MIGSELAPYASYLVARARDELALDPKLGPRELRAAELFVRVFGVPEIGVHLRISHVLRALPRDVGVVADLGCGAGMLLGAIARRKHFSRLIGFEVDEGSVRIAERAHPRAEIVQCGVENAPRRFDDSIDTAACIDVLEHLEASELDPFLSRAHALVRRGGTLVVHVPNVAQHRHFARFRTWGHHDHVREGFSPDDLAGLLARNGFAVSNLQPTVGRVASLVWELNMLVAATPLQAAAFPLGVAAATFAERARLREGNGVLAVALRR